MKNREKAVQLERGQYNRVVQNELLTASEDGPLLVRAWPEKGESSPRLGESRLKRCPLERHWRDLISLTVLPFVLNMAFSPDFLDRFIRNVCFWVGFKRERSLPLPVWGPARQIDQSITEKLRR